MKKIIVLGATAAGVLWALGRSGLGRSGETPTDPWAEATDPV